MRHPGISIGCGLAAASMACEAPPWSWCCGSLVAGQGLVGRRGFGGGLAVPRGGVVVAVGWPPSGPGHCGMSWELFGCVGSGSPPPALAPPLWCCLPCGLFSFVHFLPTPSAKEGMVHFRGRWCCFCSFCMSTLSHLSYAGSPLRFLWPGCPGPHQHLPAVTLFLTPHGLSSTPTDMLACGCDAGDPWPGSWAGAGQWASKCDCVICGCDSSATQGSSST
jgi:hypothetical protein